MLFTSFGTNATIETKLKTPPQQTHLDDVAACNVLLVRASVGIALKWFYFKVEARSNSLSEKVW